MIAGTDPRIASSVNLDKTMLGVAQLDWLKQALAASTATFKFIANGSQLLNDVNRFEGWQNFKTEREAIHRLAHATRCNGRGVPVR